MSVLRTRIAAISALEELEQFTRLPQAIYQNRTAWWPPDVQNELDLLLSRAPISAYLALQPFGGWSGGRLVARGTAVVNHRYNQHWKERLGQLIHFEALPNEHEVVAALLEAATGWLAKQGMQGVRSGFAAFLDYPYAIDGYGELPSFLLRGNPDYYHCYFKNSRFFTEKGQVDYTAPLSAVALERFRSTILAAVRNGVVIKSWREYGFIAAVDTWTDVINESFSQHWGWNPITREEVRPMLLPLQQTPVGDLSVIAEVDGAPVGAVFSVPDLTSVLARVQPGARIAPERGGGTRGALINVGVLQKARSRGIARAMTARSFIAMAERRMLYAGYTLVLDDNWPSRWTAESLGARVTNNFVTYRRDF